jgi:hypothetical protein
MSGDKAWMKLVFKSWKWKLLNAYLAQMVACNPQRFLPLLAFLWLKAFAGLMTVHSPPSSTASSD